MENTLDDDVRSRKSRLFGHVDGQAGTLTKAILVEDLRGQGRGGSTERLAY